MFYVPEVTQGDKFPPVFSFYSLIVQLWWHKSLKLCRRDGHFKQKYYSIFIGNCLTVALAAN